MSATTQNGKAGRRGFALPGIQTPTLSIATVLAVSFGLLVAIGIGVVLAIGFFTSQKNTVGLLNEKSTMIVQLIKNGVEGHLSPAAEKARFLDRQVEMGIVDLSDDDQVDNVLLGMLAAAPQITGVAILYADDSDAIATLREDGIATVERNAINEEAEDREGLVQRARETEEAFWGRLFYDEESGVTFVNIIQPLHRLGEYQGLVGVVVSMPELSEFITEIGDQIDATAFILHGRNRVLAHPNLVTRHPDLSRENPAVALDNVGDPVLANLWRREIVDEAEEAAAAGAAVHIVDIDGDVYVMFSGRMLEFGQRPWIVGAYVPFDEFDTELNRLMFSGFAGIAVLLISILAAIFLGRRLARPIEKMAHSATQVSQLDLAAVEPLEPSSIRELRDQATAFNSMLAGLKWFETYVPKSLVRRLIVSGDDAMMRSEERELTVMFTDIVGYSSLSEAMSASDAGQLLNDHFALLGQCVREQGGTIDKYIGDALMAFWGAPDEQSDHAMRACRAAHAIFDAVKADNAARKLRGESPIRVRIGVHTGPVLVGNIGAPGRINYTTVGDTVNAAERLEALGKELDEGDDVTILTSFETVSHTEGDEFDFEPVGPIEVKGRRSKLEVFRLH